MKEIIVEQEDTGEIKRYQVPQRSVIFLEIDAERKYQINKWGDASDDAVNTPWHWVTYLMKYATRWMNGSVCLHLKTIDDFRTSMIKVAAIAIAAVESIDRQREMSGKPFYQE